MYSETIRFLNTTFIVSSESMFIYASQGNLKNMLDTGLKWVNSHSLDDFLAKADIVERNKTITCHIFDGLESLNEKLTYPVDQFVFQIDFELKRINMQFYMHG